MPAPVNTDLSSSNAIPGVYIQVNTAGGSAVDNANKRVMIVGTRLSTGSAAPDTPGFFAQQSDVNSSHGQGSEAARLYAAFQSQYGPGEFEVWVTGINEPSGGTAATRLIITAGTATSAGYVDIFVCGYKVTVGIASGDTATTIGTAIAAAINLVLDLPVTAAGTTTVTLTYRHKGLSGNDLPIRVDQYDAAGITFSPGTLLIANAALGGTISVAVGATVITEVIANGVSANDAAGELNTAINAGGYPVTSTVNAATVTLLYAKGRYVRRISSGTTDAQQTVTATVGTAGAGVPATTTALANISALSKGFAAWVHTFNDPAGAVDAAAAAVAMDSTVNDLVYDTMQADCNGVNMKPGYVFLGMPGRLAIAGTVVTAAAPDLSTTSPLARFCVSWCREPAVQAFEIAARHAAIYLHFDYYAKNLDGQVLATRGTVPLLNPAIADTPPLSDQNAAIGSYYMSPIITDAQGNLAVLTSKTTSNASNQDLRESATIRQIDTARGSLRQWLVDRFTGRSYRASTPKTPNTVTTTSVANAAYVWARSLDDQDLFDDAAKWKDAFVCNVNPVVSTRFDLFVPLAIIRMLHQTGVVLQPQ